MMDGAISGKTGFTADAGYCYVGALRRDERTFIVALLACGWPNHKGYKWSDTKKLMEYGLSNYEYRNVWQELPKQEIVVKDSGNDQNIYQKNSVAEVEIQQKPEVLKVLLRTDENVEISVQMEKALSAPVEKGQKVGEVRYIIDKNIIGKVIFMGENFSVLRAESAPDSITLYWERPQGRLGYKLNSEL